MMGSEPWMLEESTRWFVKWILAVMPSTAGAVAASWTATASGLAGGIGPSLPAVAIAVPPPTTPTVPTITATRRRLDMLRKEVTPTTVDRAFEETLTALDGLVRIVRRTALEGQDPGVLHPAVADLDRAADRFVAAPARRPGHHDRQVVEQRFAVLPRGGVPQERWAVVDGVVVQVLPHGEHRVGEGRRARPLEGHALVARDIDEQRAGPEAA